MNTQTDTQLIRRLLQSRAQRHEATAALHHYAPMASEAQASLNRINVDERFEDALGQGRN